MARPQRYMETMLARFEPGTLNCIRAVLNGPETAADLVRTALARELARRESAGRRVDLAGAGESAADE